MPWWKFLVLHTRENDIFTFAAPTEEIKRLDKSPKTIKGMFDRIAPTYDMLNHLLSLFMDIKWKRKTLDRLKIKQRDSILDVATGTGDLAMLALRGNRGCRVVGLDLSGEMLRLAVKKKVRKGYDRRYFPVEGDACSMPFKEGAFDHTMVAFGIRNMSDVEGFFREIGRVLKKGGRLAILELSVPEIRFVRKIYFMHLKKLIPLIGGGISGKTSTYNYLRDSVISFHTPGELERMLRAHDLKIIESLPLWFGLCHLYVAESERNFT
jgi:demethylmenaquinone methyltransferase/2-methoxy-6-polyprenyl-1,4-benzoquinol methylase